MKREGKMEGEEKQLGEKVGLAFSAFYTSLISGTTLGSRGEGKKGKRGREKRGKKKGGTRK